MGKAKTITIESVEQASWLDEFVDVYQRLNKDNLGLLTSIYHFDIVFEDPLHRVDGRVALTEYFEHMYANVTSIKFDITDSFISGNKAALYWTMTYQHTRLNGGRAIHVLGHSKLQMKDNKVIAHRDYFDLGQLLYEHIPLYGATVRWLKNKASQ